MIDEVRNSQSAITKLLLTAIENAPSIVILLYLVVRQDNFITYLVQQCIVR
jgi:hypothetical protein